MAQASLHQRPVKEVPKSQALNIVTLGGLVKSKSGLINIPFGPGYRFPRGKYRLFRAFQPLVIPCILINLPNVLSFPYVFPRLFRPLSLGPRHLWCFLPKMAQATCEKDGGQMGGAWGGEAEVFSSRASICLRIYFVSKQSITAGHIGLCFFTVSVL